MDPFCGEVFDNEIHQNMRNEIISTTNKERQMEGQRLQLYNRQAEEPAVGRKKDDCGGVLPTR
jgi:hypothetical protein